MRKIYLLTLAAGVALSASAVNLNVSKSLRSPVPAKKEIRSIVATDGIEVSKDIKNAKVRSIRKADSEASIEGSWIFTMGDYYFQSSVGIIDIEYVATLDGDELWFEDPTNQELPFVAEYDAASGTLTFGEYYLGFDGRYYIYQMPYVYDYSAGGRVLAESIVGIFDASRGYITFTDPNGDPGLQWAAFASQNPAGTPLGYFGIYDFVQAEKDVDWVEMEEGSFNDNMIYPMFTGEPNGEYASVQVFQNPFNPGVYRVMNPFKALYSELGFNSVSPTMEIDAIDPDNVILSLQSSGIYGGEEDGVYYYFNGAWYYEQYGQVLGSSIIPCTLTVDEDGYTVVSFPERSCFLLASATGTPYYLQGDSTLKFKVPNSGEGEGETITGSGNMTYQVDMWQGTMDEPELTEPETHAVTATYTEANKTLVINDFQSGESPISFVITDFETGAAEAADQVAYEDDDFTYYYSDVATQEAVVYATVENYGEDMTIIHVEPWGEGCYIPGYGFYFNSAFYNTEILLDMVIPGLVPEDTTGVTNIEEAASAVVRYFDINGIEVKNPKAGQILIKVSDGKASKVIMR